MLYIPSRSVHLNHKFRTAANWSHIFPFLVMENRLKQTRRVRDEEQATAISAAAFVIYSLYLRNLKEVPVSSSRTISIRQDSIPTQARENAFPVRRSPQNQRTSIPPQNNDFKTRADVWEKANLQKIHRRYEKIKSKILAWETEQKKQAKLQLERKNMMDPTRAIEQQRYQNKIARIDMIARTARAQLEDKRRKEESQIRETAKQIRETGRVPAKCFCCFIL